MSLSARDEARGDRAGVFQARPLSPDTWSDLEQLFGLPGGSIVCSCWCMFFRKSGRGTGPAGEADKQALGQLVNDGTRPGLIGYVGGQPAGWISLGPREEYLRLRRSRIMKPVDDTAVWSVVCSYVARPYRGQGLQHRMLAAAIEFAREQGVAVLEAYPVETAGRSPDDSMFFGARGLYEQAGFAEVVRRSPSRVVMRLDLDAPAESPGRP
jgi:GNAT superfamily N-acetyltransferase